MPKKKKKKKSWKRVRALQRERQIRQQRAQEAYQIQREREAERKPRKWPKGKIVFGCCLIVLMFGAYGAWQHYNSQLPPSIGGSTNNPAPTGSAPNFSLRDINGTQFSLNQFSGKVIAIHFMAVGCGGQIDSINDNQLKQLKSLCNTHCGNNPVTIVSVAVATCQNSELARIRTDYGITWVLGNDYHFEDGTTPIVEAYSNYPIRDGSILLIDKAFNIAQVYTEKMTATALATEINRLLEA
jgi:peroxiredoxin